MAFREFLSISTMYQRNMGKCGRFPACSTIQMELAEGIVEVIVATNYMCHAAIVIVDNDRQHICRRTVSS